MERTAARAQRARQPGYFFDMTSNGYLAISLLPEPDDFRHNVHVVIDTVNELIG